MNKTEYDEFIEYLANNTPPMITEDKQSQLFYNQGFHELRTRAIRYLKGVHNKK